MSTVEQPSAWTTPHQTAGLVVEPPRPTDAIGGALRSAFAQRRALPAEIEATLAQLSGLR